MKSIIKYITCGVPQGSIPGPSLFIIYISDTSLFITDVAITMYVDDTSLYEALRIVCDLPEQLISAIVKISDWPNVNKSILIQLKTEFMIIG